MVGDASEPGGVLVADGAETEKLVRAVLGVMAAVVAGSAALAPLLARAPAPLLWFYSGLATVVAGSALALWAKRPVLSGRLLIAGLWLGNGPAMLLFGGVHSPGAIWYLPLTLGAAVVWDRRSGFLVGAASMLLVGLAFGLETAGRLPAPLVQPSAGRTMAALVAAMLVSVVLAFYSARGWARTLGKALHGASDAELLAHEIADAIVVVDEQGVIRAVNPAAEQVAGCPRAELVGRGFPTLGLLPPEALAIAMQEFEHVAAGGHASLREIELVRRDGTHVWMEGNARRVLGPAGRVRIHVTLRDVTARKAADAERAALEEQMARSRQLEALGRLAAGVAHDFNNLLTVVLGNTTLVMNGLAEEGPERERLTEVRDAADQAANLVQQLLAFARQRRNEAAITDLNESVRGMRRVVQRLLGSNIRLAVSLDSRPCIVSLERSQVEQVLLNLAVNARDAMPGGGVLAIVTELTDDGAVQLIVSDEGIGMSPETASRIFEPFFTTKGPGKGTGLGLATVHGIVEQARGSVAVESAPGRGTTFRIRLPRAAPTIPPQGTTRPSGAPNPGLVLVVDDDRLVRDAIARILRSAGYQVLVAGTAEAAIETFEANAARIALVITDLVLPTMSGQRLTERIARTVPSPRILVVSGGPPPSSAEGCSLPCAFLPKPFASEALLARVRAILEG